MLLLGHLWHIGYSCSRPWQVVSLVCCWSGKWFCQGHHHWTLGESGPRTACWCGESAMTSAGLSDASVLDSSSLDIGKGMDRKLCSDLGSPIEVA